MTLPTSGNPLSFSQVDVELGLSATAQISMNDTAVRTLFGVASGAIGMSSGFGKSKISVPGAPTIGTATAGNATASVAFTAPSCTGGASITGYQAKSSPGCITATGSSSPISVTGLTNCTAYTFQVRAQNSAGYGSYSSSSNSVTPSSKGSVTYSTPGTYTWVAPAGVTKVSVVAVGGGAGGGGTRSTNCSKEPGGYLQYPGMPGGGGGLAWINNYSVTPGNSYTVVVGAGGTGQPPPARCKTYYGCVVSVGGSSYFVNNTTVKGGGAGRQSDCTSSTYSVYGGYVAATGSIPCRIGLAAYSGRSCQSGGQGACGGLGGGGAGGYGCSGYVGWGGVGCKGGSAYGASFYINKAQNGGGGGGGSGTSQIYGGGGGGGVGVSNGKGSNGQNGFFYSCTTSNTYGGGGSGGCNGGIAQYANGSNGGLYGGGGGGAGFLDYPSFSTGNGGNGANGVVRIIWPGCSRKFPTTCVGSP